MDSNPFSSRYIRPGAVEYQFSTGFDIGRLLARFRANRYCGQILGPHGTGKSTLLWTLKRELEREKTPFAFYCLHADQSSRAVLAGWSAVSFGTVLIIDGFEQLSFWKRWIIRAWTRMRSQGLIITGHRPLGLPILWNTTLDVDRAIELANQQRTAAKSTESTEFPELDPDLIRQLFWKRNGNLREIYFDLYDYCEHRTQIQ